MATLSGVSENEFVREWHQMSKAITIMIILHDVSGKRCEVGRKLIAYRPTH